MSIVSSETIAEPDLQAGNVRRVRYEFIDHLGDLHGVGPHRLPNYETTPFAPQNGQLKIYSESAGESLMWDGSSWQVMRTYFYLPSVLDKLKHDEIDNNIELFGQGVNIFASNAEHQTDNELFYAVLSYIVQLDIINLAGYHRGIPHASALNNPKITGYGFDWGAWGSWMSNADTLKVAVNNYAPMSIV